MRRVQYERSGGPEVLEVVAAEMPVAGPGELLVKVEAVGVTLSAIRRISGEVPQQLRAEVAGEVVAVGDGVDGFDPGYRVVGLCADAYAEYAVLPVDQASAIPDGASAVDAVALMRSGLVALGALDAAAPREGETALVTAAAGGVGHLAVQLARVRGAGWVVAAVSDEAKADFVRGLGADEVVTYDQLLAAKQADFALDGVGGAGLGDTFGALAEGGRVVTYGTGGGLIDTEDLLAGGKTLSGFRIGRLAQRDPARYEDLRQEVWQYYASGLLHPVVHAEFGLDEAAAAHAVIEQRANLGKVVLVP
ncbi:zinc-binding dehydrogenase [Nocardia asteroides NBRC 15531]|uniref:Quinone oxidoreductase n=1 Tax=Nocardia asteroides NBRC 15531 TaxID=1110697 RepID=U5ED53_NOCAS|nr:zinc-binding dehydrogenase [Nocardia asteroides]TLF70012.1 zinc-binding dehydrogenase [Nocardia asteroides NBRC 15531]UGT49535.1 zinc-binding dehydrogenase [Nocardia asteroides]SFL93792.1 NADPH:quinone reductase [Nocardia asteroides]VEG37838.1 Quinone oxidoreductase 1 [Nocardia asteroides]GAD84383.1 putative quinone oxidoreductase [Nocardia asteroides NBRC 15531]